MPTPGAKVEQFKSMDVSKIIPLLDTGDVPSDMEILTKEVRKLQDMIASAMGVPSIILTGNDVVDEYKKLTGK